MQKSPVKLGPADLDQRLTGWLGRPLDGMEWRSDLRWHQVADFEETYAPPFLVARLGHWGRWQSYEPLKTRRLAEDARALAREVGDESSDSTQLIESFANRYGFLGQPGLLLTAPGDAFGYGEPLAFWERELGDFHALTRLWGVRTSSQLEALVPRTEFGARRIDLGAGGFRILERSEAVGRSLADAVAAEIRAMVREKLQGRIGIDELKPGRPLRFQPDSLIAAIYVDFAMEIAGQTGDRIRECDYCCRTYHASRKDSKYCSPTCRSQARHARAIKEEK